MQVHLLASGSSGNAMAITHERTCILLDAGISCRKIIQTLATLRLSLRDVSALLITHTHSDHIAGLKTLMKQSRFPVYASLLTCAELAQMPEIPGITRRTRALPDCLPVEILSGWEVTAVPLSHDAPGCCGYRIDTGGGSVGILTDSGVVTAEAERIFPGVNLAVLEANYEPSVLLCGPYPAFLKQRIASPEGHLSNEAAAQFAVTLAASGTSKIILSHISQKNNHPALALQTVESALYAEHIHAALFAAAPDQPGSYNVL